MIAFGMILITDQTNEAIKRVNSKTIFAIILAVL